MEPEPIWRIELLGGLRALGRERKVTRLRTQKTGALLAWLAYFRGRSHPREVLVDLLWPEHAPTTGRARLREALSSLRRQLEPPGVPPGAILIADRASVNLDSRRCATDVADFEAALDKATRAGAAVQRRLLLEQALDLYRGELLPSLYDDWVLRERDRLRGRCLDGLHALGGLLEAHGDLHGAVACARRAVAVDPLGEEARRDLMGRLAGLGKPREALREWRVADALFRRELGGPPSPALTDPARAIERQLPASSPPSRAAEGTGCSPGIEHASAGACGGLAPLLLTDADGDAAERLHEAIERRGGALRPPGAELVASFQRTVDALSCARAALEGLCGSTRPRFVISVAELSAPRALDRLRTLLAAARPELPPAHAGSLPPTVNRFFGRERELAAGRVQVLPPARILERLGSSDLLVSRRRDAPARHRTLRAAIAWSFELLRPPLRRFFARLSVFRDGFTVEAAQAVCDGPQALEFLSELSNCHSSPPTRHGPSRAFASSNPCATSARSSSSTMSAPRSLTGTRSATSISPSERRSPSRAAGARPRAAFGSRRCSRALQGGPRPASSPWRPLAFSPGSSETSPRRGRTISKTWRSRRSSAPGSASLQRSAIWASSLRPGATSTTHGRSSTRALLRLALPENGGRAQSRS